MDDGLPSAQVYEVIQDPAGYIWFGTDRGLVKYNGYEFKVYTVKDGLSTNVIFKLDIDAQGRVCCYGKDRRFHIQKNERFVEFKYNDHKEGLISTVSNLFDFDFHEKGFSYSTFDRKENSSVFTEIDNSGSVRHIFTDGIHLESGGEATVSIKLGSIDTCQFHKFPLYYDGTLIDSVVFEKPSSYFGSAERNGNLIYFSVLKYLYEFNTETKELQLIKTFDNQILDLALDNKGDLYIGIAHSGLWKWNINRADYFECLLPNRSVPSVFIDAEDGIWASTLFNGIYYCGDQNNRTFVSDKKPLVLKEIDSTIFILSEFQALYSFNVENLNIENEKVYNSVDFRTLLDYQQAPNINLNLFEMGVFLEKGKIDFTTIGLRSADNVSVPNYLVQINRSSINIWDKRLAWEAMSIIETDFFLNCGEFMDSNRLILGTDIGVVLIDNSGYKLSNLYNLVSNAPLNQVDYRPEIPFFRQKMRDILNCEDSIRVFASSENGLLIETNGHRNRYVQENDGLICNEIDGVLYKNEQLVVITKKGVSVVSRTDGIRNYTIKNGLLSNNVKDVMIFGDKLWVATDVGTSILQNKRDTVHDFSIYLTGIDVNLTPRLIKETIQLNFQQDLVDLSFEGLSFPLEGDIIYKYQLKGVDPSWTKTPNRTVRYANLPYGEFEFWISAQKRDKTWTIPQRLVTLNRIAPFWQTIYFETFIVIVFIGLTWLFFSWKYQRLQQKERNELQVLNLERKTLQAQMNPHFIFNSLTSLQHLIVKNDTESANEYLGKFARLTRIALQQSTQNWVKLKDELKLLEHYIELEQIRFPDHFGYEIQLKMKNIEIYVPPFLIQPFIENAILHGLAKKKEGGMIQIVIAQKDEKMVQFIITDNGVGRSEPSTGIERNKSLGIRLVKERLQLLLKMKAVTIIDLMDESEMANGTKVVVYVPYKKKLDESINN